MVRARDPDGETLPEQVESEIVDAQQLLVLTDFDGTLSNIVSDPDEATIRSDARKELARLAEREETDVAVVSGRALQDVADRAGMPNAWYAGNHGLEIEVDDETFVHPVAEDAADAIQESCRSLRDDLADVEGAIVEDKGLTATVHYRSVDENAARTSVEDAVRAVVDSVGCDLRILDGKQIVELRPAVDWGKGRAVEWITETAYSDDANPYRLYFGDDVTDEAAFRALDSKELAARVGEDHDGTAADVQVQNPARVAALISSVADLRQRR